MKKLPDSSGHFDKFGGKFIPEVLFHALDELEKAGIHTEFVEEIRALGAGQTLCQVNRKIKNPAATSRLQDAVRRQADEHSEFLLVQPHILAQPTCVSQVD